MQYGVHDQVSANVPVVLVSSGGAPVNVELTYDTREPYAVTAVIESAQGYKVTWWLSRDLLADGLLTHAGDGDVRVSPAAHDTDLVHIELVGPTGRATLEAFADDIATFLEATNTLVMPGDEARWFDVDAEFRRLTQTD
jgi:hypothetical protein